MQTVQIKIKQIKAFMNGLEEKNPSMFKLLPGLIHILKKEISAMWPSIIKIHIALQLCVWKTALIIFTFHICQDIVWCYILYVLAVCHFLHPL